MGGNISRLLNSLFLAAKADAHHSGAIYEQLEQTCKSNNLNWLLMRTLAGCSVVQFILNNYSMAIEYTHRALGLAKEQNDHNGAFSAWSYLIEYYRFLGNYQPSLRCVQRSLPLISTASLGQLQRFNHYAIMATALNSAGCSSGNRLSGRVSIARESDRQSRR